MATFVFIKEDNEVIRILHGESIEVLKNQHLELQRGYNAFRWEDFCQNVNMGKEVNIIDPSLDFMGKEILILFVEGKLNGEFVQGYEFYVNKTKTKMIVYKQSNFTIDLKWIFVYVYNVLNGIIE